MKYALSLPICGALEKHLLTYLQIYLQLTIRAEILYECEKQGRHLLSRRVEVVEVSPPDDDLFQRLSESIVPEHTSPLPRHVFRATKPCKHPYDRQPWCLDVWCLSVIEICRVDIREFGVVVHHLHHVNISLLYKGSISHTRRSSVVGLGANSGAWAQIYRYCLKIYPSS